MYIHMYKYMYMCVYGRDGWIGYARLVWYIPHPLLHHIHPPKNEWLTQYVQRKRQTDSFSFSIKSDTWVITSCCTWNTLQYKWMIAYYYTLWYVVWKHSTLEIRTTIMVYVHIHHSVVCLCLFWVGVGASQFFIWELCTVFFTEEERCIFQLNDSTGPRAIARREREKNTSNEKRWEGNYKGERKKNGRKKIQ